MSEDPGSSDRIEPGMIPFNERYTYKLIIINNGDYDGFDNSKRPGLLGAGPLDNLRTQGIG